jgi:hypothetical protein
MSQTLEDLRARVSIDGPDNYVAALQQEYNNKKTAWIRERLEAYINALAGALDKFGLENQPEIAGLVTAYQDYQHDVQVEFESQKDVVALVQQIDFYRNYQPLLFC